jgi:hypothetical protein
VVAILATGAAIVWLAARGDVRVVWLLAVGHGFDGVCRGCLRIAIGYECEYRGLGCDGGFDVLCGVWMGSVGVLEQKPDVVTSLVRGWFDQFEADAACYLATKAIWL